MFRQGFESLSEIIGSGSDELGRRNSDLFSSTLAKSGKRHETLRASQEDGLIFPNVVLPADFDAEDFFVSVATYYPNQSPLTAFVHVLSKETAEHFRAWSDGNAKRMPEVASDRRYLASLGAAMGEAFLAGLSSAEGGVGPTYSACKRSLAYTLCRAKTLYPLCGIDYVAQRWIRLRHLTGLGVTASVVSALQLMHELLFGGYSQNNTSRLPTQLQSAIAEYSRSSLDDDGLSRIIVGMYPQFEPHVGGLNGPFDARMKAFTQLVELVHVSPHGAEADSLTVAFLCNQILPGSFAHAKVLAKLVEFYPTALVWYGMFCASSKDFVPSQFNFGLILKLVRDISHPFSFESRPSCDIALDELEILMRLVLKSESIKPTHQKIALVALLPGVEVFSRFSAEDDHVGERERGRRLEEAEELNSRVGTLLEDALMLLRSTKPSVTRSSSTVARRQKKRDR